ncbi:hypothetical protein DH2020_027041 [Rehmannia glutinosa]|uniref:Uncharacterized protein n=1 Tax=Rehmannia glutinosa TaxID=99300 RepID=A0ABR0VV80_REHGL
MILGILEPMTAPDFHVFCGKLGFHHGIANKSNKIWRPGDYLRAFTHVSSSIPWLLEEILTAFLHLDERTGSTTNRHLDMKEFGQMISDCGLVDAGFVGPVMHTWVRNSLHERLNRFLVNHKWTDLFPKYSISHLSRVHSDHASILFKAFLIGSKPTSAFRFMKMWTRHSCFLDVVAKVWNGPTGSHGLDNFNLSSFGLSCKLLKLKSNMMFFLNQAIAKLVLATKIEEDFWHQKSSCKWIVEVDRNTKYFHTITKQKRLKSRISSIEDNGITLTDDSDIRKSCIS